MFYLALSKTLNPSCIEEKCILTAVEHPFVHDNINIAGNCNYNKHIVFLSHRKMLNFTLLEFISAFVPSHLHICATPPYSLKE